jgi:hypothetical protein
MTDLNDLRVFTGWADPASPDGRAANPVRPASVDDLIEVFKNLGAEVREYRYDYYDNHIEPGRYLVYPLPDKENG